MQNLEKQFKELNTRVEAAMKRLNLRADQDRLEQLETRMATPGFWDEPQTAAKVSQEAAGLRNRIESWVALHKDIGVALELAELGDSSVHDDLQVNFERLSQKYAAKEFELKLSGEHDRSGAIVTIQAGAGGTDAQDWAEMLLRMYLRYAEVAGWQTEIANRSGGEEAGIKNATIEINGEYAYGKLKSEKGVHRLVRLSPFNSASSRETSFAAVDVIPQLDRPDEFEIDDKELRIDTFRSGGHGGQSVNTTDSAVRITHLPTGEKVTIQDERSQLQNKEKAMRILKARLKSLMEERAVAKLSELRGERQAPEWGSQIRSYTLHPSTRVKDHRTGIETSQAQAVLDGDIEIFIEAYLRQNMGA